MLDSKLEMILQGLEKMVIRRICAVKNSPYFKII